MGAGGIVSSASRARMSPFSNWSDNTITNFTPRVPAASEQPACTASHRPGSQGQHQSGTAVPECCRPPAPTPEGMASGNESDGEYQLMETAADACFHSCDCNSHALIPRTCVHACTAVTAMVTHPSRAHACMHGCDCNGHAPVTRKCMHACMHARLRLQWSRTHPPHMHAQLIAMVTHCTTHLCSQRGVPGRQILYA